MSLQLKLTLSFILITLITAGAVGGSAYGLLMWNFRQSVEDRAFMNFHSDLVAYIETYGSWAQAIRKEPFPEFVRLRHTPIRPYMPLREPSGSMIPRFGQPPFRFLLLSSRGRVLLPIGQYQIGQIVPSQVLRKAQPIRVNGKIAVIAVPIGAPVLSYADHAYLALTRRALITGVLTAGILALLAGLLLSRRMYAALGEVTVAVRAMQPNGELRLQIPVRSHDEIGELTMALNHMSVNLAKAHQTMKHQSEELLQLSIHDPLTGLYNRRHFDEQVTMLFQQAIRYKRPLTVVICDLDHFKQVNDLHSHAVGDEALRQVAQILRDNMRSGDIIARYGGEEFVIACSDSTLTQAASRCEDLRRLIEAHPWQELTPNLKVTASMGLSDSLSLQSMEKMLAEADTRLYEAKRAGRNCIVPAAA